MNTKRKPRHLTANQRETVWAAIAIGITLILGVLCVIGALIGNWGMMLPMVIWGVLFVIAGCAGFAYCAIRDWND